MTEKENVIKIINVFPNIGGSGILLTCRLLAGKLEENDFILISDKNKIQVKEVENITRSSGFNDFSFVQNHQLLQPAERYVQ